MKKTSHTTTASTNPTFLYIRPDFNPELDVISNLVMTMGSTASRAVTELRTRTIHPDGRRENVSEHSHMLSKVAPFVAAELYPELDPGLVSLFSSIHDDPEMYVGDTPTDTVANHDQAAKEALEALGIAQLEEEFMPVAPFYVKLMLRYEKQEEPEARFTRIMDKFMVLNIHIPNQGEVLRANYTYDEMLSAARKTEQTLRAQYPEWTDLIEARTAYSDYLARTYIRDWDAA